MDDRHDSVSARSDTAAQYGEDYYASHCGPIAYSYSNRHWMTFFGKIADELIRIFRPCRVFDAGCAHGFLVASLWDRGVTTWGRDISNFAISKVRADVQQFCAVGSLADPIEGTFDLVVSIEVLEHMTEKDGMQAIANMTAITDRIVFSSSPSDLDEPTHINVKPAIYWMRAFAEHNFVPLIETTIPSITAYALAFEKREKRPHDDYLIACAEIVRSRIQIAYDQHVIGGLNGRVAELERAVAEGEERARNEVTAIQTLLDQAVYEQARLIAANEELTQTRMWRVRRALRSIGQQISVGTRRLGGASSPPLTETEGEQQTDPLAKARATAIAAGFDAAYYLRENPDVAAAGLDPLEHYISYGRAEGRYANILEAGSGISHRLRDFCNPDCSELGPRTSDQAFCISVLTPTYNTAPRIIRELFQTLVNQSYSNWEWVVVDDGSSESAVIAELRTIAESDSRVRLIVGASNLGISGASNIALTAARGTHAALVDHDDLVSRDAFLAIFEAWKGAPTTQLFFTDECKLLPDGTVGVYWTKPDWSPAYLENTMCLGHLSVYELEFLRKL
jgi:SAM-dependent methyltransferase